MHLFIICFFKEHKQNYFVRSIESLAKGIVCKLLYPGYQEKIIKFLDYLVCFNKIISSLLAFNRIVNHNF